MVDRRIRLDDTDLLYLRTLVVDDLVRGFASKEKPTYESAGHRAVLVRRIEGAIGGGSAGRVSPYGRRVGSLKEARALRPLPPWVERKMFAAMPGHTE